MTSLKSYIFPDVCCLCKEKKAFDDTYICQECSDQLDLTPDTSCKLCSAPIDSYIELCHQCIENPRPWSWATSPLAFKGQSREVIHKFKYNSQLVLSRFIVKSMITSLKRKKLKNIQCISAVPMHWFKQMCRGFNQAELLAQEVSRQLEIPYKPLLKRKSPSSAQALKNRSQRKTNISQIFKLNEKQKVPDGTILLVDDVLTTGATLTACSKVLLDNGAREICILTAARG